MSKLTRYSPSCRIVDEDWRLVEMIPGAPDGEYVKYEDALAAIREARAEVWDEAAKMFGKACFTDHVATCQKRAAAERAKAKGETDE